MKARKDANVPTTEDPSCHPGITPGNLYVVIGIDFEDYRVIDDSGEPYLFRHGMFDVIDDSIPEEWVKSFGEDIFEFYIDPPGLDQPGFYEDYFDGDPKAVLVFREFVKTL